MSKIKFDTAFVLFKKQEWNTSLRQLMSGKGQCSLTLSIPGF